MCGTRLTVRHDYLIHSNNPKRHCGCLAKKPQSFISKNQDVYHIWRMVIVRCCNPKHKTYKSYGGRGIKICDRWKNSFEAFLEDVGPRLGKNYSLDRGDPDGDYEPIHKVTGKVQVRWATSKDQGRNKRKSLFLPHPKTGMLIPAAEYAEMLGVRYQTMRAQLLKEGRWPGQ